MVRKQYSLAEIADLIDARLQGDGAVKVDSIAPIESASANQLSFIDNPKYRKYLASANAGAIILSESIIGDYQGNVLISENPYLAYAKASTLFKNNQQTWSGIHPSAIIDANCTISKNVIIAANVVIEADVTIVDGAVIGPGCVIGSHSYIGKQTRLFANVTLYAQTTIGARCLIHSGVVLGADGFGFAQSKQGWYKVPQHGGVVIGNDVEIGANTTVDRGALGDTIIGNGVKLDNQIQIGHNVVIGDHTIIAGCTAVAGSVRIGSFCMIAGGASIAGHLTITDKVVLTGNTGVANDITESGVYSGGILPVEHSVWRKNAVTLKQLHQLAQRVKKLEQENSSN